ncbi:MAG: SMI1/KNR4 family protein [Eggerthellaceae bacterium]|nr:SMI1/KNR4 family protein [Eggerthellaceae bacterium]
MNDKISALIAQYESDGDFTHVAPTAEMLEEAQSRLGVVIPQQFVDYLNAYSHGGIGGIEILGIGLTGKMVFLDATLRYREHGLPNNLLVVENCDEWLYCLDCDNGKVVSWSQIDGTRCEYPSFDDFLIQDLEDAIANLYHKTPRA